MGDVLRMQPRIDNPRVFTDGRHFVVAGSMDGACEFLRQIIGDQAAVEGGLEAQEHGWGVCPDDMLLPFDPPAADGLEIPTGLPEGLWPAVVWAEIRRAGYIGQVEKPIPLPLQSSAPGPRGA